MINYYKMFNTESLEEVKMIAKGDDILMTISRELEEFLNDEETQRLFDRDLWQKREYRYEGEKAEKLKTARKMLIADKSLEEINLFTELPLEEIQELQKSLKNVSI